MCGIAGLLHFDGSPVAEDVLRRMAGSLAHRGPDGEGVYLDGAAGIAHRRLAIIDLTGGVQPMSSEDGTVWIAYNGEVYNHRELRRELEGRGHRFRTACDTEAVLHAYEEWGEACVGRLRGMFAFAVLDARRRTLLVARDRLGIKPLYYLSEPGRFAFASELQSLGELDDPPRQLDLEALDLYLNLAYIPAPHTIFRNVYKLPPGHTLSVSLDRGPAEPRRYWDVRFEPDEKPTEAEWIERLDEALRDAVRVRLMSDVPFGAFLSGGTDSSAVVAYMAGILDAPVKTFSIGFDSGEFSELPYARHVAERFGTEHHEEVVRPEALRILPEVVRHHGEPFGDSSAIPTYYVSRLAARHVKMVLSGDGGDEVFAGYPWCHGIVRAFVFPPRGLREGLRSAARKALGRLGLLPNNTDPVRTWYNSVSVFDAARRRRLWRPEWSAVADLPRAWLEAQSPVARGLDVCSGIQYLDLKGYLPYDILAKVDIASMAHGLEARVPLLDHELIELCARMPWRLKLRQNGDGRLRPKYVFRKVVARRLGEDFLDRPKQGFSMPLGDWFAGESRGALREAVLDRGGRLGEYLDTAEVGRVLDEHGQGRDRSHRLWVLLVLAEWLRQHERVRTA